MLFFQQRRRLTMTAEMAIRRFGGIEKFTATLVEAANKAEVGSREYLEILLAVVRLQVFCAEEERAKKDNEDLQAVVELTTNDDVGRELDALVADLIRSSPQIAIDAAARLGWTVIPPAEPQSPNRGKREPLVSNAADKWVRSCM